MKLATNTAAQIIPSLFIFLFVYTALSKLMDFTSFVTVLGDAPLIGSYKAWLAWTLPVIELLTSILLFFPGTRLAGLYATLSLLSLFTAYIVYMILFASHLPCSCGGVVSGFTWKQHLLFNLFLLLVAGISLRLYHFNRKRHPNYLLQ